MDSIESYLRKLIVLSLIHISEPTPPPRMRTKSPPWTWTP